MIVVKATDRSISATPVYPITSGSVGLPVIWTFSEEWDGLSKIAVFRGSGTSIDVALLTDRCTVPAEVLEEFGDLLWIGVYGANSSGQVVIPTIWCQAGLIREGVVLAGVDPAEPTPSWVAQVQAAAASALSKATAVEEAAEAGDFDGVSPIISVSDITGGHRVTFTDAEGTHTVDVMDGAKGDPGESPVVAVSTITGGHRVTIADVTGTHSFNVMDGTEGDPGDPGYSPTVSVTNITGGHRVTITDASGAHTFDVMDGEGGADNTFTAIYGTTTSAEIEAAYQAGKEIKCVRTTNGQTFVYDFARRQNEYVHDFGIAMYGDPNMVISAVYCDHDVWHGSTRSLASLASPAFTGTPTVPTPDGTNTGQAANVEYVDEAVSDLIFVATYGTTTSAEIEAAYQAGKTILCLRPDNGVVMPLTVRASATVHRFGGVYQQDKIIAVFAVNCENNTWGGVSRKIVSMTSFAGTFGTSASYAVGDYCIHDGNLYRFTSAHAPGAWSDTEATLVMLADELSALRTSIPDSASDVGAVASNQGTGNAGKFLVVGSDGIVAPVTMQAWSGGTY